MNGPFLAMIMPINSDARPDNSLPKPQPPLGIWGGGNVPFPTPPMAPGGGGHWGQANDPGYGVPGPHPGSPTHPIYIPGLGIWGGPWFPLGTWGGVGQPYPDQGLPGQQPGGPVRPDNSLPGSGLGTWGPNDPRPTPPIYLPPQAPVTDPDDPQKAYVVAYAPKSDGSGYERITFTVEIPEREPPTEATPKTSPL